MHLLIVLTADQRSPAAVPLYSPACHACPALSARLPWAVGIWIFVADPASPLDRPSLSQRTPIIPFPAARLSRCAPNGSPRRRCSPSKCDKLLCRASKARKEQDEDREKCAWLVLPRPAGPRLRWAEGRKGRSISRGCLCPSAVVPAMSPSASDPQQWYMLRYAIKLHLTHPVALIGLHVPQVRRHAGTQPGTQPGTSFERHVPRSARPINNSICPKRLRILPDRLPCLSSLPLPKGSSCHTQMAASPLPPDLQTKPQTSEPPGRRTSWADL